MFENMKFKSLYLFLLCGLLTSTVACSDSNSDYIPPAIEEPEKPAGPDDVYNEPKFELHKEGEPFDSYRGLVMTGYQGWFGTPDDGCSHSQHSNTAWYHYRENDRFEPGVLRNSIDFWPDMREYEVKYPVESFTLPGGGHPTVYSAYDKSSVLLHFKWMKEYGIDGAFMQRFVGEVIDNPDGKDHFDKVLESAMEASNTHQRAICVMYDLGGFTPARLEKVLTDAQDIMDKYQLKDRSKQKYYLHDGGKPMITLWGVGFNDNRPYSLTDIETLMNGLKEKGFSLMLGVPTYWRERRNDALADAKLHDLIKAANVIMPWFVGRYGMNNYSDFHSLVANDIKWCETNGVDYAPLCFPGSSDRNMHPENGVNERYGGKFLWNQMYHCINSGAQMLYMAMFDEIDEGTALYKCLNKKDVPSNEAADDYYVRFKEGEGYRMVSRPSEDDAKYTLASDYNVVFGGVEDDLQTDHYLWLTGQGRLMLRGETPLSAELPVRK